MRTTTTGVLLINADAKSVINANKPITNLGLVFEFLDIKFPTLFSTPVLTNAPERTNIAIMVHGAGFERIERNSSLGSTPKIIIRTAIARAVTSTGIISIIKKVSIKASKTRDIVIS
jgi:hypothetical protein